MGNLTIPVDAPLLWDLTLNSAVPDRFSTPLGLLQTPPRPTLVLALIGMIKYGTNVGYCGPDMARATPNAATARKHADLSRASTTREVTLWPEMGSFDCTSVPNFID